MTARQSHKKRVQLSTITTEYKDSAKCSYCLLQKFGIALSNEHVFDQCVTKSTASSINNVTSCTKHTFHSSRCGWNTVMMQVQNVQPWKLFNITGFMPKCQRIILQCNAVRCQISIEFRQSCTLRSRLRHVPKNVSLSIFTLNFLS